MSTPERHPGGRPTKLTPERTDRILAAIRAGNYLNTACAYAGISYNTLRRWLTTADTPDATDELREFREALERARAEAEIRLVGAAVKAAVGGSLVRRSRRTLRDGTVEEDEQFAPPDGRTALEILSRSYGGAERWTRRSAVEVSGAGGGPVQVEFASAISVLAERLAELGDGGVVEGEVVGEGVGEGDLPD